MWINKFLVPSCNRFIKTFFYHTFIEKALSRFTGASSYTSSLSQMQKFENPQSQTKAEVLSCPWPVHYNRARGNHQEESSLQTLYWAKSPRGWRGRPWRICTSFFQGSGHCQTPSHQTQHYCSGSGPRAALQATDHAGVTDLSSLWCSHTAQEHLLPFSCRKLRNNTVQLQRCKTWSTLIQIIHWKLLTCVLQMPLLFITKIFKCASEGYVNFKFHSEQQLALPNT